MLALNTTHHPENREAMYYCDQKTCTGQAWQVLLCLLLFISTVQVDEINLPPGGVLFLFSIAEAIVWQACQPGKLTGS